MLGRPAVPPRRLRACGRKAPETANSRRVRILEQIIREEAQTHMDNRGTVSFLVK